MVRLVVRISPALSCARPRHARGPRGIGGRRLAQHGWRGARCGRVGAAVTHRRLTARCRGADVAADIGGSAVVFVPVDGARRLRAARASPQPAARRRRSCSAVGRASYAYPSRASGLAAILTMGERRSFHGQAHLVTCAHRSLCDVAVCARRTFAEQAPGVDVPVRARHRAYSHHAATLLLDMETHRPIDVFDGRTAESFAAWLREHPGVEIICRDRGGNYAEGARSGTPGAVQVADRFHLWAHLGEVVEKTVIAHRDCLQAPVPAHEQAQAMSSPSPRRAHHRVSGTPATAARSASCAATPAPRSPRSTQ